MLEQLLSKLKFFAVQAIARAEEYAAQKLEELGEAISGTEKREWAKTLIKIEYRKLEQDVPLLNATEIDDAFVDQKAGELVDTVFNEIGAGINNLKKLFPPSSAEAPELPAGGVQ